MVNAFLNFSPLLLNHIKFFSNLANLLKSSVQHLCEIWRELLSYEQVMKYLVHNRVNFLSLPGFISNLTGGVLIVYNKNLSYFLHISQEVLWFGREMFPDQGLINLKTWSLLGGTIEEIMKSLRDAGMLEEVVDESRLWGFVVLSLLLLAFLGWFHCVFHMWFLTFLILSTVAMLSCHGLYSSETIIQD